MVQDRVSPGALLRLGSAWNAQVQRQVPQRTALQGSSALVSGPAPMLVITRVVDPTAPGWDDILVIGPHGVVGWTYLDPTQPGRLERVSL